MILVVLILFLLYVETQILWAEAFRNPHVIVYIV